MSEKRDEIEAKISAALESQLAEATKKRDALQDAPDLKPQNCSIKD